MASATLETQDLCGFFLVSVHAVCCVCSGTCTTELSKQSIFLILIALPQVKYGCQQLVLGSLKSSSQTIKLTKFIFLYISSQQYCFLPVYICKGYNHMFQYIQDGFVQYYVLLKLSINIFYYC